MQSMLPTEEDPETGAIHAGSRLHTDVDATALHHTAASLRAENRTLALPPDKSGLRHAGLEVASIEAGKSLTFKTGDREYAIIVLSGHVQVACDETVFQPALRTSVFEQLGDLVYVPRDSQITVTAHARSEVALPSVAARERLEPFHIPAREIPQASRGAGPASRQIIDILGPTVGHADRMVLVEGLAPGGSWSSYPPHKHDDPAVEGEAVLEELYYFRLRGHDAWALHRTYDLDEGWDVTATICDGDVFVVPRGYHGPTVTPPEYDLYFLNVLAGDGTDRSLAFSDDPAHAWIRDSWNSQQVDPRLPLAEVRQ